jgi:hypothetical protein
MQAVLDEIIEKSSSLTSEELQKLINVLQKQSVENSYKTTKRPIDANTAWIKENHAKYAGNYVALKDGELIGIGKTIKEVDLIAKEKGVKRPLLHYMFPLDETPFGGW